MSAGRSITLLIDLLTVQRTQAELVRVLAHMAPSDPLRDELAKSLAGLDLVVAGLMEHYQ